MSQPLIDLRKYPGWALADEMQQFCKSFFEKYSANYVDYARYYHDGRTIILTTDRYYVNHFLNHDAFYTPFPGSSLTSGLHLWESYIDLSFLRNASIQFQHAHGLTIVTEHDDYNEIFNIATPAENRKILSLYLNQQHEIQTFREQFRNKASKLIQKSLDSPLILPDKKNFLSPTDKKITQNFFPVIIQVNNTSIPLTNREAECLYYLHQGKTAKEIGKILEISNRTVEIYLDQLRAKTQSKNRLELLSKLNRNQIESFDIADE